MRSIFIKEIRSFFNSLIGYMTIGLFLTGIGLYMWVFPATVLDIGMADMSLLFEVSPYVFMFLIPAITMRSFAEEKKSGTIELLLTRPITEWQLILGKYLACLTLVVLALIPTLVYFFTIYYLGNPVGNLDVPGITGAYFGLILLAAVYTAIGVLTSSLTENQIISFTVSAFATLLLYEGLSLLSAIDQWSAITYAISQFGLSHHYNSLSRGVIDLRNVVYLLSLAAFFLYSTRLVLTSRKW